MFLIHFHDFHLQNQNFSRLTAKTGGDAVSTPTPQTPLPHIQMPPAAPPGRGFAGPLPSLAKPMFFFWARAPPRRPPKHALKKTKKKAGSLRSSTSRTVLLSKKETQPHVLSKRKTRPHLRKKNRTCKSLQAIPCFTGGEGILEEACCQKKSFRFFKSYPHL